MRIKKSMLTILISVILCLTMLAPTTVSAKTPEIMSALKSYIQAYGAQTYKAVNGKHVYTSKISYQKSKKRFLFECTYTNGSSVEKMTMYMPTAKKKASYTVNFSQIIRAAGRVAKMSGKATLRRKTYSDQSSYLKFSRKNGTKDSKKISSASYQAAANSMLRYAFKLWEYILEKKVTLCFRNFGFRRVTVIDKSVYAYEW